MFFLNNYTHTYRENLDGGNDKIIIYKSHKFRFT